MINNRKLIVDTHCEIYDFLKTDADDIFWNFQQHVESGKLVDDAIYVIGRRQMELSSRLVRELVEKNSIKVIFSSPSEGSDTMRGHCLKYNIFDLANNHKILLVAGGNMESTYRYLYYENFLPKIFDYEENVVAASRIGEIFDKHEKPYKFLFLNGRRRHHRKYLLKHLLDNGLLDQALWSNLDHQSEIPVHFLPNKYEVDRYRNQLDQTLTLDRDLAAKHHLFRHEWGEVYINVDACIDSYFSLVTETVFDYPYSFRTEKIWKPVAMGHPWIVASNQGYYRDMHDLGFQTFGHVIDESFDQIENNQDRLNRIGQVVEDLCQQDLVSFLKECYNVCKYNQQHLAEMRIKVRQDFPEQFHQFVKKYYLDE